MRKTRVVHTTYAVTSAYKWQSNRHKFSKMFTTDKVVGTTDTDVRTTNRVNVYNWPKSKKKKKNQTDQIVRTTDRVIIIPTDEVYVYNEQGNVHRWQS